MERGNYGADRGNDLDILSNLTSEQLRTQRTSTPDILKMAKGYRYSGTTTVVGCVDNHQLLRYHVLPEVDLVLIILSCGGTCGACFHSTYPSGRG